VPSTDRRALSDEAAICHLLHELIGEAWVPSAVFAQRARRLHLSRRPRLCGEEFCGAEVENMLPNGASVRSWPRLIGPRVRILASLALVLLVVATLSLVVLACWPRQNVVLGDAHRLPRPEDITLPTPAAVHGVPEEITEAEMRNVLLHVDDDLRLGIRHLRGRMNDLSGQHISVLDNKNNLSFDMAYAEIGLTAEALTIFLNRYVFGYRGSPLKDLVVHTKGNQIVQTGTMHKIIDIPFEMTATLSVTNDGRIRIHTTRMEICNLDGEKLLRAVGRTLEDLLDLSGAKGVTVEGNDLLLDPLKSLPPPKITGRLTGIRVEGNAVVQTFGSAGAAGTETLALPVPAVNYVYFRGGNIRFGKLYMVLSDLLTIDGDPSDPFDFYLDYYHSQLVNGYHVTLADYALVTWMPDFDDIGLPKGKLPPPPLPLGRRIDR
jgi:hypothetical protein